MNKAEKKRKKEFSDNYLIKPRHNSRNQKTLLRTLITPSSFNLRNLTSLTTSTIFLLQSIYQSCLAVIWTSYKLHVCTFLFTACKLGPATATHSSQGLISYLCEESQSVQQSTSCLYIIIRGEDVWLSAFCLCGLRWHCLLIFRISRFIHFTCCQKWNNIWQVNWQRDQTVWPEKKNR